MNARLAYKMTFCAALLLLLSACAFQMIYPRLPFLIGWQLDSYLDLDDEQEDWLEARLHHHLREHRRKALPRYVDYTRKLQTVLQGDHLDEPMLRELEDESRQLYLDLMRSFLDDGVELFSGLSDKQVDNLLKKQQEEAAEDEQDYTEGNAEERAEKRFDNTLDDMSDLVGRLNTTQKELIRSFSMQRQDAFTVSKATRERWQQLISESLLKRHDKTYLRAQLSRLIEQPDSLRDSDYMAYLEQERTLRYQMQIALFSSLSAKQRAHLQNEISDWENDFTALMKTKTE